MHVLGNGDEPSVELKFGVVSGNFIEGFCEGFDGDIFGIGLVFGAFEHKSVDFIPIMIQKKRKGYLVSLLG